MDTQYAQLRIWRSTLKKLRRIYADTGDSIIAIVDRLATQELEKLEDEHGQNVQVQALPFEKE